MKLHLWMIIINIVILIVIYLIHKKNKNQYDLVVTKSTFDNKNYLVRNEKDKEEAAILLSKLNKLSLIFIKKLLIKYPNNEKIKRLAENYKPNKIHETNKMSPFSSYTLNKGEHIHLCLRDKTTNEFEDYNTLVYVLVHELGHLMTLKYGHHEQYWQNFLFLLENAVEFNMYKYVNYKESPVRYCGVNVTDTVFNRKKKD